MYERVSRSDITPKIIIVKAMSTILSGPYREEMKLKMNMNSRTAQRYPAIDPMMVHLKSRDDLFGRLCDISQDGMAFEYVQLWDNETLVEKGEMSTVNILKNGTRMLKNGSCSIVYSHSVKTNRAFPEFTPTCRCGLEFQNLTPSQVDQLENILILCGACSCV